MVVNELVEALTKENKILKFKIKHLENQLHHFCPDCRDKVAFESCLRCQVQTLTKQRDKLQGQIDNGYWPET